MCQIRWTAARRQHTRNFVEPMSNHKFHSSRAGSKCWQQTTSPQSGFKSPFSDPSFVLALFGIRRLVAQIKAIEQADLPPLGGMVVMSTAAANFNISRPESQVRKREIGNLLPNNRRQRRTCYALCHLLYPVSAAQTSIFRMDSNSTSYSGAEDFDGEGRA